MASVEERFQAAVNVIKGLPKNGPYQPSTGMMLRFYGFYKQATEGPCHQKKPAFWDVVGKAKYDAWNANRHMNKQQAMLKYVEELREIIETMSYTENVQNFVGSLDGLDNINLDELDMIAPGMREMAESHPDSPFNSRTNSPQHGASANVGKSGEQPITLLNGRHTNASTENNGGAITPEAMQLSPEPHNTSTYAATNGSVDQSDDEYGDPVDMQHDLSEAMLQNCELLKQIQATVLRMNSDLKTLNQRVCTLEKCVQDVRGAVQKRMHASGAVRGRLTPKWWPFDSISPAWFLLLVLWPFITKRLSRMLLTQQYRK